MGLKKIMPAAYIVDACRTAGGRKGGALSEYHPSDLGAAVVDGILTRTGCEPGLVEDVIFGCVSQSGAQAGNIGRNVVLSSNLLPQSVPGTAVDRQCGSSQQAIHFAAQAVMSGTQDIVIAGGVENMSIVPIGANVAAAFKAGHGTPSGQLIKKKYMPFDGVDGKPLKSFSQFEGAEFLARDYNITRAELDQFGADSHARAVRATEAGYFKREIVPVEGIDKKNGGAKIMHERDEGIRPGSTVEGLAKLPALKKGV